MDPLLSRSKLRNIVKRILGDAMKLPSIPSPPYLYSAFIRGYFISYYRFAHSGPVTTSPLFEFFLNPPDYPILVLVERFNSVPAGVGELPKHLYDCGLSDV